MNCIKIEQDILNDFQTELTRLQSSNAVSFRREMEKITSLLNENILNLNDSILNFFLNYFIQLLKQWRESAKFIDKNDAITFENLESMIIFS